MGIGDLADGLLRGVETLTETVTAPFSDPVVRLGVTGLSRAGKTVFITALVANLMNRGRMQAFRAAHDGTIRAAFLQPQPDDTLARFDYEGHLAALTGPDPRWPDGTRSISQLRLSFRIQPSGMLGSLRGARTLHLDIIDYPGEWLLDVALMEKSYADWSAEVLARMPARPGGEQALAALSGADAAADFSNATAQALAAAYTAHLTAAREAGFSDCTPGRFLMPGDLAGSPALTFAPLPLPDKAPRGSLYREFERRFEAYKSRIVKPFFRDHFARIDRQVVLVDVLGAIHAGPPAVEDMRRVLAEILSAFNPGRIGWLAALFGGRRVDRILFAATKADHLHSDQHARLTAILSALVRDARDRADFAGARTESLAIASLRTTTEEVIDPAGEALGAVRGTLIDARQAAFYPGELPSDPATLLSPARDGAAAWLDGDYAVMRFAPAKITMKPGDGPPHIRLDRAAEFLLGDKFR
ncbi:YcjX family protein [Paracoccus sp. p3-h83]|uniref:YcjX family protein n=1 Tax=Paracoccus sp. p3-h83 TaxID=3342805 RepID=UPI0035BAAB45